MNRWIILHVNLATGLFPLTLPASEGERFFDMMLPSLESLNANVAQTCPCLFPGLSWVWWGCSVHCSANIWLSYCLPRLSFLYPPALYFIFLFPHLDMHDILSFIFLYFFLFFLILAFLLAFVLLLFLLLLILVDSLNTYRPLFSCVI